MSYTPTTDEVRKAYVCQEIRELDLRGKYDPSDDVRVAAEFDRWLAALIREAKAEALEEAANAWQINGWSNDMPEKGAAQAQIILHMAQATTDMLCARAAEYRKGGAR